MVLPTQQLVVSMLWERHVLAATISQRNVLNQVLIANTKQHSPKNMGRFLASLFTAAAATPKVGGTRRPVPLSRSAARSHCRRHRQGSVAIQGYHNPVGDPSANSPGSGIPPLREETQRQGERRKSAETGGEELIFNP